MQWEELTSDEFARASVDCGRVCVVALGCIERHGPHMPLGTDMINGQQIAVRAAQREPAIVFPPWYFAQIYEAKCFPGTITIPPAMLVELLLRTYDEIAREINIPVGTVKTRMRLALAKLRERLETKTV